MYYFHNLFAITIMIGFYSILAFYLVRKGLKEGNLKLVIVACLPLIALFGLYVIIDLAWRISGILIIVIPIYIAYKLLERKDQH